MATKTYNVLVINLDRSPDRWASMERQLSRLALPATRVSAVDGRGKNPTDFPEFDAAAYAVCHGREPMATEVACYLSHIGAMQQFLNGPHDYCVILEDDAVLADDFSETIDILVARPKEWDLMLLFGVHSGGAVRLSPVGTERWIVGVTFRQTGSTAYLINRACAARLVTALLPMSVPFDHAFTLPWKHGLKMRACVPFPVPRTKGDESTIGWGRRKKPPVLTRARVLVYRARTELCRVLYFLVVDPVILKSLWRRILSLA